MSKTRILFATLGLAAAVAIPTIALASGSSGSRPCCEANAKCCTPKSACCDKADKIITCPVTGETIKESECPLCKGHK